MKPFDYYQVNTVAQAVVLLTKYREKAAILAGGSDLLGMMKDRIEGPEFKMPQHLIDIKGIKGLVHIQEQPAGLSIGAATTLAEIASSELVAKKYPLLAQAAKQVAVPQIRNVATLGGNLCQRTRCWYFRGKLFSDCLRKGGGTCYAPDGENQYHAILKGNPCWMVHPSDMAPALMALEAKAVIVGPKGKRLVPLQQFFVAPEQTYLKETVLAPQEMMVGVEVPLATQKTGVFLKLKERQSFDFALASVAVALTIKGGTVLDSRVVFGGIAPLPFRSAKAEAALKGKEVGSAISAACAVAVEGAEALSKNAYKIQVARGILEQALSALA
jgi:xanthine dehydrogenase YagS FAD-binding subunit